MSRLDRMPVRLRVTLAFAGVMTVLLAAIGLFLYLRLGAELDATIARGLRSRADDVAALVAQADSGLAEAGRSPLTEGADTLAQILDSSGHIVDATPVVRRRPVLTPAELRRALRTTITLDRTGVLPENARARLLATPVHAQGQDLVVVVGDQIEDRDNALRSLAGLLLVGGPIALLLASLAGYGAAAAALAPVERMRRRAAAIDTADPGARLPVPAADDELGRLGGTLNAMLERLQTAFERERTFVADASHELRTPLAILKAELELALRSGRSREQLTAALRSAAEETDRLVGLAEDLLVIARADQGRLPIRRADVAVGELLDHVRARFARRAGEQQAQLERGAGGDLHVDADPLRLEQALGNLVDNALRHGGRHVELAAEEDDAAIRLHVRDDGAGFPDGFAESAFERFSRADVARGRGGVGLGLAIVASIAHAHGGSAGAENRPDGGADVWLALPGARPQPGS